MTGGCGCPSGCGMTPGMMPTGAPGMMGMRPGMPGMPCVPWFCQLLWISIRGSFISVFFFFFLCFLLCFMALALL